MNTPQVPNNDQSKVSTIPRWTVPIYWVIGLLIAHNMIPWGFSLLSMRYGWVAARPGTWNLLALILVAIGLATIIWTMILHFVRTPE